MIGQLPYIPGHVRKHAGPLPRYLPQFSEGIVKKWLESHLKSGALVLDPFGISPHLPIEAAACGYRVIVTSNNPVIHFVLRIMASEPKAKELQAALAAFASLPKGNERLEQYIKSLYTTVCVQCGKRIMADSFIWERDVGAPIARVYSCNYCGDAGEYKTTVEDITNAHKFSRRGFHIIRALEKVAPLGDPDRVHVREALNVHPSRALYALFTLLNGLDRVTVSPQQKELLQAILLSTCDFANTLTSYPIARPRPKRLTIPPLYREMNLWLALEKSVKMWISDFTKIPLVNWPQEPSSDGGISLYKGRIKEFVDEIVQLQSDAVIMVLPRPNQAFWTLSVLWAAWLWGKETIEPIKYLLRRRRYDWAWHNSAVYKAFQSLVSLLPPSTPIFGLITESEPNYLSAAIVAARMANVRFCGAALRGEHYQTQVNWKSPTDKETYDLDQNESPEIEVDAQKVIQDAGKEFIQKKGEPVDYIYLHTSGLINSLLMSKLYPYHGKSVDVFRNVNNLLEKAYGVERVYKRFDRSVKSLEVGKWWVADDFIHKDVEKWEEKIINPLSDRIENSIYTHLAAHSYHQPRCTIEEIDQELCSLYPGLFTPNSELISILLHSYGKQVPPGSGLWQLRRQERPEIRLSDIREMIELLRILSQRLDFQVKKDYDKFNNEILIWKEKNDVTRYLFFITVSAELGKILLSDVSIYDHVWIIIPGGRTNTTLYKINSNPLYQEILTSKWQFIKFRHIRHLETTSYLKRSNLLEQFSLDPLTYTEPQMRML